MMPTSASSSVHSPFRDRGPFTYVLVRKRVDELWLVPRQLSMTFEHAHGDVNLALLQAELRECCNRSFTLWIRAQRLIATSLRSVDVLLPLEKCQTLVNQRQHVHWVPV